MSLKLYRPTRGGLEPSPVEQKNWRRKLRASRWDPAALENPEGRLTTPGQALLFLGGLALITFVILLVGYGSGFWA